MLRLMRLAGLFLLLLLPPEGVSVSGQTSEIAPADRQAVLETSLGSIVLDLFPDQAPHHVEAFMRRVEDKFYVGTVFHQVVPMGVIQGGDPLSRDLAERERYGTGGLLEMAAEFNDVPHLRGTISAVLVPGNPDSAGSQFFICVSDQPQLDGQYTAFGRVVEGLETIEQISRSPSDAGGRVLARIEIVDTFLRLRPEPELPPFADVPPEELLRYSVVMSTDLGDIEFRFYPDLAPQHVRQFLRLSQLQMYTGTQFHRIVPGFVIQGGLISGRQPAISADLEKYLTPLQAEFNKHKHVRGTLSMARSEDPDSGMDSFFVVLVPNPHLDGKYTAFGEVVRGIDVVDGISQLPTRGETPIISFLINSVQVRGPNN